MKALILMLTTVMSIVCFGSIGFGFWGTTAVTGFLVMIIGAITSIGD